MFRIFGPPGTGKTTKLLDMVDQNLSSGIASSDIAFLAFTRKAANEAKERASLRFNLDPKKDLFYFRTLHSLALTLTDIRTEQVLQNEHYKELGDAIGVSFGVNKRGGMEDMPETNRSSDPVLSLISLATLRKVPLREQYNESRLDTDWNTVAYISEALKNYKEEFNMYDFTDMLKLFVENGDTCCPNFAVTFLDEAQDLSPLQWDLAHLLDRKSERMYCAGDDDQAIYRWAGADVDQFINLNGSSETLSQSYRVPTSVWNVAQGIAKRINRRFPKDYKPREGNGMVKRISTISELDMAHGSWLIVAQAGYQLHAVASELKSSGILFNYKGHRSVSERIGAAVNGWEQLRKGARITGEAARAVYRFMSVGGRIQRGFKKLPAVMDEDTVSLDELITHHGLMELVHVVGTPRVAENIRNCIWHEAVDRLPDRDRAYIVALLRRGEKFNGIPRINVSTIHGSKGGEADNVVVFTDLSPAADESMRIDADDIHRTFYVGVTRTKENLFIVEPEDISRSYDL